MPKTKHTPSLPSNHRPLTPAIVTEPNIQIVPSADGTSAWVIETAGSLNPRRIS